MFSCQPDLCLELTFIWGDWQDLINCAQYSALSSASLFMQCTHWALAASSDCQYPREAGAGRKSSMGQGVLFDLKEGSQHGLLLFLQPHCTSLPIFQHCPSWLMAKGESCICRWHYLERGYFSWEFRMCWWQSPFCWFTTQEIKHTALVSEQDKIKQLNCQ